MLRFGDIAVVVSNAEASQRWYCEKLGFTKGSSHGHWQTVVVPGAQCLSHLCQAEELEPGTTGIGFVTPDVAADNTVSRPPASASRNRRRNPIGEPPRCSPTRTATSFGLVTTRRSSRRS